MIIKKFEIFWDLPKCDRDIKWAHAVGKMVPVDLLNGGGLPQIFNLKKYPQSTVKQSSIKQALPVWPCCVTWTFFRGSWEAS